MLKKGVVDALQTHRKCSSDDNNKSFDHFLSRDAASEDVGSSTQILREPVNILQQMMNDPTILHVAKSLVFLSKVK